MRILLAALLALSLGCSDATGPVVANLDLGACILGDVTGDGIANTTDAQQILRYAKGYPLTPMIAARIQVAGNVDGNEFIDEVDAYLVGRFSVGLDVPHPIGDPCS